MIQNGTRPCPCSCQIYHTGNRSPLRSRKTGLREVKSLAKAHTAQLGQNPVPTGSQAQGGATTWSTSQIAREGKKEGTNDVSLFGQIGRQAQGKAVTSAEPGRVYGSAAVWVRLGDPEPGRAARAQSELSVGARAAPAPRHPGSGAGRVGRCAGDQRGRGAWRGAGTDGWSA